jgi:hypothetical protein
MEVAILLHVLIIKWGIKNSGKNSLSRLTSLLQKYNLVENSSSTSSDRKTTRKTVGVLWENPKVAIL